MAKQRALPPELVKTVKKFARSINQKYSVDQFIVFGSQAKGTANEWSDIDICVVSSKFGKDLFNEKLELLKYSNNIDFRIEPTPMHPDVFTSRYDTLASEVREHGIAISL